MSRNEQGPAPADDPLRLEFALVPMAEIGARHGRSRNDAVEADGPVARMVTGAGDDTVTLPAGGGKVRLGAGDDTLRLGDAVASVNGGAGEDRLVWDGTLGEWDVSAERGRLIFHDRFTGEEMRVRGVETFAFDDRTLSLAEIRAFASADMPSILVGRGTQTVTVNDPDPTVSVVWDRVVQQAVIEGGAGVNGPTVATRAYAMVHTAIYDAWASFDAAAVRVSHDAEGDNAALEAALDGSEAAKVKAMSFAALTVLRALYPHQAALFEQVMAERFGLPVEDDGSAAAAAGIDAAEDLLALRLGDGSNQTGGYAGDGSYRPVNPNPLEINDIARWTPENVPIDPEDGLPVEQSFLTPHWKDVEGFALPRFANGETDFAALRPDAPQPFFTEAQTGATLDVAAGEITLGAAVSVGGVDYAAGDTLGVSKALIGPVINPAFIAQAEEVVAYSANLTDEQKIIAEFWEDGGGTAFPPGTFMTFAQFVSARDGHDTDTDAKMFLAMANGVLDAGIATWESKVYYDYARPVRVIRELGELGLIGEPGVDEVTGEAGHVIEAWGGINPETGLGRGTMTILASNFVTFQFPGRDPSPPFAEYTSGHSAFSGAGAKVLELFTGSAAFGGSVVFQPGSTLFEFGVPDETTTLSWDTFRDAADQAGLSRLYGGIHFTEGDLNGRSLGAEAGALAYDLAEAFWTGAADEADRPFMDALLV